MKAFVPEEIVVERGSEESLIYRNLRAALPQVPLRFVEPDGQSPWRGILSETTARGRGSSRRIKDISAANGNGDFGAAKKKL
ncbi:MAG: hypothetical protein Q8S00_28645, partial [Deltaproteobacteria bacterium]|nr:hypothetical protein [Deltaproteobacteria bacterium]